MIFLRMPDLLVCKIVSNFYYIIELFNYLGLLAMTKILKTHPNSVHHHEDLILYSAYSVTICSIKSLNYIRKDRISMSPISDYTYTGTDSFEICFVMYVFEISWKMTKNALQKARLPRKRSMWLLTFKPFDLLRWTRWLAVQEFPCLLFEVKRTVCSCLGRCRALKVSLNDDFL